MTRNRKISSDVVAEVFRRVLQSMANPDELVVDECPCEDVGDVDELITSLLSPAMGLPEAKATSAPAEVFSGTKPISIRLHNRVINAFKVQAIKTGTPYQTLMHQALTEAAEKIAV